MTKYRQTKTQWFTSDTFDSRVDTRAFDDVKYGAWGTGFDESSMPELGRFPLDRPQWTGTCGERHSEMSGESVTPLI